MGKDYGKRMDTSSKSTYRIRGACRTVLHHWTTAGDRCGPASPAVSEERCARGATLKPLLDLKRVCRRRTRVSSRVWWGGAEEEAGDDGGERGKRDGIGGGRVQEMARKRRGMESRGGGWRGPLAEAVGTRWGWKWNSERNSWERRPSSSSAASLVPQASGGDGGGSSSSSSRMMQFNSRAVCRTGGGLR